MLASTTVTFLSLAAAASAHMGCSGQEVARRNPGGRFIAARQSAPTDESSAASSTDATYECAPYTYGPVNTIKGSYPTIWQPATLVPGDTEAAGLFATVNATLNSKLASDVPHCAAADCIMGDFTGVPYTNADPDCWWSWNKCTTPAASTGLPSDMVTVPEPLTWGLGFDDGPNCSHNAFYDYLAAQNQKATMFYIGSNVMDWPLQALRGIADGHQICVHTWSHRYMTALTNDQAFAELYYSRKAIKDILGVTPLCWRPPFGDVDNRIRTIAQSLNLTTILWGYDSFDWKANVPGSNVTAQNVTSNYQSVINNVQNGTFVDHGPIVLTHELNNFTMGEATNMLPAIKTAFKYVVPLCAAMNQTHPYVETNITCPNFASYIGGETNTSASTTNSGTSGAPGSTGSGTGAAPSGTSGSGSGKSGAASVRPATLGWVLAAAGAAIVAL